jgi:ketosteroid isomerase-like protein
MMTFDAQKISKEVWRFVQEMNRLWTEAGTPEKLRDYFHPSMITIAPSERLRIEGQEACVNAWRQYVETTNILDWKEIDPKIQIYGEGNFAVVSYYFDLSIEMKDQHIDIGGRDMLVLAKEDGHWWVIADQFSPFPAS